MSHTTMSRPRPYEIVPISIRTILSPPNGGRRPKGNHQALAVKGERHPMCAMESNHGTINDTTTNIKENVLFHFRLV